MPLRNFHFVLQLPARSIAVKTWPTGIPCFVLCPSIVAGTCSGVCVYRQISHAGLGYGQSACQSRIWCTTECCNTTPICNWISPGRARVRPAPEKSHVDKLLSLTNENLSKLLSFLLIEYLLSLINQILYISKFDFNSPLIIVFILFYHLLSTIKRIINSKYININNILCKGIISNLNNC